MKTFLTHFNNDYLWGQTAGQLIFKWPHCTTRPRRSLNLSHDAMRRLRLLWNESLELTKYSSARRKLCCSPALRKKTPYQPLENEWLSVCIFMWAAKLITNSIKYIQSYIQLGITRLFINISAPNEIKRSPAGHKHVLNTSC